MKPGIKKEHYTFIVHTILNSYAMLFFSNRAGFALAVLLVSFFNPYTGLAGLVATIVAALTAYFMGFSREQVKSGLYTYSALLLGLGMGTFYAFSLGFWILLVLASMLALLLSAAFIARLGKSHLPALSMAFIFALWVVILSAREFGSIGLTARNIYWLNEMYATGGEDLIRFVQWMEEWPLPAAVEGFFRSVSAILFQSNIAAGIVLTLALLFFSRIALSLMIAGYSVAIIFIQVMDGYAGSVNYYNLGTNFMLVSVALGGFYIIPSLRSYLWSLITVPISYLLVIALWKITYTWGLPVFSLPFCITVIVFMYVLQLRQAGGRLVLTPIQYFSPEENLYRYRNSRSRIYSQQYFRLALPFMGEWTISQGYDGIHTHKGDWAQALDFVITNEKGNTWQGAGARPEDFYCFNKPVLCPADAEVEEVVNWVDDNPIGGNNTQQNWGNTVVLKHAGGLYTKLSHLKKGSIKVNKGDFVKKGALIGACGNSGRSPEPHLHFQVQSTPYIDSRTISYPLSYYLVKSDAGNAGFNSFQIPTEGERVSNLQANSVLQEAFDFKPGFRLYVKSGQREEEWEVMVSVYNETYFYCQHQKAYAYFVNDGQAFFFTHFFGNRSSLLWLFYLSAYKVVLSSTPGLKITDHYPLDFRRQTLMQWWRDLLAPFWVFTRWEYTSEVKSGEEMGGAGDIIIQSSVQQKSLRHQKEVLLARLVVRHNQLYSIEVENSSHQTTIQCAY